MAQVLYGCYKLLPVLSSQLARLRASRCFALEAYGRTWLLRRWSVASGSHRGPNEVEQPADGSGASYRLLSASEYPQVLNHEPKRRRVGLFVVANKCWKAEGLECTEGDADDGKRVHRNKTCQKASGRLAMKIKMAAWRK